MTGKVTPQNKSKVETTKVATTPATTPTPNKENANKKRKEPEPKQTTTPATTTKTDKKTTPKPTTPKPTTPKEETKKETKTVEKKQQPQKKQKSEPTPATTTTTTTPIITTTPIPIATTSIIAPSFSIFDSLKNTESVPTTTTTTTKSNKSKSTKTTTTTTTTATTELSKAFSKSNEYSAPDIKMIDEKIQDVLKEIKESSPEEATRREQKDKIRLKKDDQKTREEENKRTIFISNINLENATDRELRPHFKQFGVIASIRFRSVPLSSVDGNRKETFIKKEFHQKRETCNAYIVFTTTEQAKKAVNAMNGKELFGRHLRVDMADHKPVKEADSKTCFIGNIPYEAEEEELFLIFDKTFGDLLSVRIIRDNHTNIGKGFGYANFKTDKATTAAVDAKSITFNGREIRIFPSKSNPKSGKTIKEKKKIENRKPSTRLPKKQVE